MAMGDSASSFSLRLSSSSFKTASLNVRGALAFLGSRARPAFPTPDPSVPTLAELMAVPVPQPRGPSKSRTVIRMLTTKFKPSQPTPDTHAAERRAQALRERGLLPPLPARDLSAQEMAQDMRIPVVAAHDQDSGAVSAADLVKRAWEARNNEGGAGAEGEAKAEVEEERMRGFRFGGPVVESQALDQHIHKSGDAATDKDEMARPLPAPPTPTPTPLSARPLPSPPPRQIHPDLQSFTFPPASPVRPAPAPAPAPTPSPALVVPPTDASIDPEIELWATALPPIPPSPSPAPSLRSALSIRSARSGRSIRSALPMPSSPPPAVPTLAVSPSPVASPTRSAFPASHTALAGSPPAISLTPPIGADAPSSEIDGGSKQTTDDSHSGAASGARPPSVHASSSLDEPPALTQAAATRPLPKGKLGALTVQTPAAGIADGSSSSDDAAIKPVLAVVLEDEHEESPPALTASTTATAAPASLHAHHSSSTSTTSDQSHAHASSSSVSSTSASAPRSLPGRASLHKSTSSAARASSSSSRGGHGSSASHGSFPSLAAVAEGEAVDHRTPVAVGVSSTAAAATNDSTDPAPPTSPTSPTTAAHTQRTARKSLNPFKRSASSSPHSHSPYAGTPNTNGNGAAPTDAPRARGLPSLALASLRRSITSASKSPASRNGAPRTFDAAHLPASPTRAGHLPSVGPAASGKRTPSPGVVVRQAVAPVVYSRGSILLEASAIEDEESRRVTELAFLG